MQDRPIKTWYFLIGILGLAFYLWSEILGIPGVTVRALPRAAAESSDPGAAAEKKAKKPVPHPSPSPATQSTEGTSGRILAQNERIFFTPDEVYCLLQRAGAPIEMGGQVRIESLRTYLEDSDSAPETPQPFGATPEAKPGLVALVHSTNCPAHLYSVVRFAPNGKIESAMDCHSVSPEQLLFQMRTQGDVRDQIPSSPNDLNLAVSGNGYFLKTCGDGSTRLTRDGRFHFNAQGTLTSEDGCHIGFQDQTGHIVFGNLDNESLQQARANSANELRTGCYGDDQCVAVVDILSLKPEDLQIQDSANINLRGDASITLVDRPYLMKDALEDVTGPERNLTGTTNPESWPTVSDQPKCDAVKDL